MSKYEWEQAEIVLPSAAVAPLKQLLTAHANQWHDQVRTEAIRLHKSINTRSATRYEAAVQRLLYAPTGSGSQRSPWAPQRTNGIDPAAIRATALRILEDIANSGRIHQPTVADVDRWASKATNRTTTWHCIDDGGFSEASISLNGRILTWSVMENNHAVDRAHATSMAGVLFGFLDRLTWTRGTGGHGVGNDEYNEDDREVGGGGNYVTFCYGPLGQHRW